MNTKKFFCFMFIAAACAFSTVSCGGSSGSGGGTGDTGGTGSLTSPVPGGNGVITASSVSYNSLSLSWQKATDNDTPQEDLEYMVVMSTADNVGSVSEAEANGTVVAN